MSSCGAALSPDVLDALADIVGPPYLKLAEELAALDPGWHPDNFGAGVLVSPSCIAEVAAIVRLCADRGVPLVPQAGRTGLVGGSVSCPGEVVLSLARMNRIEHLDVVTRVAVVQAGCTLEALQTAAAEHGLEPGIDLAARGSATVGGMVSTNAGGVMAFRNGVMRHRVLGLEAVLPDGTLYSDLSAVVKNSAGYDLKHLFIGAEGTLGVVTRVVVKLDAMPQASATALFGLPSVAAALDLVRRALNPEAGHLRAAEALWQDYLRLTAHALHWHEPAFPLDSPLYLLLGLGGTHEAPLRAAFESLYAQALAAHPQLVGLVASSARQESQLWRLREDTEAMYRVYPGAPSYDVSVPLSHLGRYVEQVLAALAALDPALRPLVFGHLADGNLHIVLNCPGALAPAMAWQVNRILYEPLPQLGGSFSAEHGVGSKRVGAMVATAGTGKLALMASIKRLLDPRTLMNPGKVLPNNPQARILHTPPTAVERKSYASE